VLLGLGECVGEHAGLAGHQVRTFGVARVERGASFLCCAQLDLFRGGCSQIYDARNFKYLKSKS
jgi:hypothetical protein